MSSGMERITVLRYCGATDKGGRNKNEDAYNILTLEHASSSLHVLAAGEE